MTGQRTPEQLQAVKRGRIAATLKREQREAAANAAQHFNITLIEALAMVWTLRRWLLAALSEHALYVGIGSGKKTSQRPPKHGAAEVVSADLQANTQSIDDEDDLPPINPANNRSTHQGATA